MLDISKLARKLRGEVSDPVVVILGGGGIGANLALSLASGDIEFAVFDDDIVEISNLNRIPIPTYSCGTSKVEALKHYIRDTQKHDSSSSHRSQNFYVRGRVNNMKDIFRLCPELENRYLFIVDCRDTLNPDVMFPQIAWKLTYDGGSRICLSRNPTADCHKTLSLRGARDAYAIIPSFYLPPNIEIDLFLRFLMSEGCTNLGYFYKGEEEKAPENVTVPDRTYKVTLDIEEVIKSCEVSEGEIE